MTIHWPRNKVSELISLLEEHPLLWDITDPDYWKRNKKDAAIQKILNTLEMPYLTIKDVKGKINIIRTQYRKELRSIEGSNPSESGDEAKRPSLWCFERLRFLRPFVSIRPSKSNTEQKTKLPPDLSEQNQPADICRNKTNHWPRSKIIELISLLKKQPLLWDVSDPSYLQKAKKEAALQKILNALQMPSVTIKDLKEKINILRAQYKKELREIEGSHRYASESDEAKKPSLWCFNNLNFLQPVASIREGRSSTESEVPLQISKKLKLDNSKAKPSKVLRKATNQLKLSHYTPDEATTLSASWEMLYRKLEPRQQLYANKTIIEVLYQGALGNLDEYSCRVFENGATDSKSASYHSESPMTDYLSETMLSQPSSETSRKYSSHNTISSQLNTEEYLEETIIVPDVDDDSL